MPRGYSAARHPFCQLTIKRITKIILCSFMYIIDLCYLTDQAMSDWGEEEMTRTIMSAYLL